MIRGQRDDNLVFYCSNSNETEVCKPWKQVIGQHRQPTILALRSANVSAGHGS
jgi:hypothetical protein